MAISLTASRAQVLAALLPSGSDVWVALFDGDPLGAGVELTAAGYARKAHSAWTTSHAATSSSRTNVGAITFDAVSEPAAPRHWVIYDAQAGGNALRSGLITDDVGEAVAIDLLAGDVLEFGDGQLTIVASEVA